MVLETSLLPGQKLVPFTVPSVSSAERVMLSRDRAVITLWLLSNHWDSCAMCFSPLKGTIPNVAAEKRKGGGGMAGTEGQWATGIAHRDRCIMGDSEAVTLCAPSSSEKHKAR